MSNNSEGNATSNLLSKLAYPVLGVVALLVVANLLSSSSNSRPEKYRDDFLGRVQETAEPWMGRVESVSNTAGNIFDAGASYAEKLTGAFNREPNGE